MRFAAFFAFVLLVTCQPLHADTLVYEGFDYAAGGNLAGNGGGTGLSGTWALGGFNASISNQQDVASGSLTRPNLVSSGNKVTTPSLGALGGVRRTFASNLGADGSTVYLSFLIRADSVPASGFFGLYLDSVAGEPDLFIGKPGGGALSEWVLEDRGGSGQVDSNVLIGADTVQLVVKAEFLAGNDKFSLFVNPGLTEPLIANAVKNNINLGTVDAMVIYSNGPFSIDEIRIGTTFADVAGVPLPAVAALLPALLMGRGLLGRRRRL